MNPYAQILFRQIESNLDRHARELRNKIFSEYRSVPWTREQYQVLQTLVRQELDALIQAILGNLDNVGGVLPADVLGFTIRAMPGDIDLDAKGSSRCQDETDIRDGNLDLADMWREYCVNRSRQRAVDTSPVE